MVVGSLASAPELIITVPLIFCVHPTPDASVTYIRLSMLRSLFPPDLQARLIEDQSLRAVLHKANFTSVTRPLNSKYVFNSMLTLALVADIYTHGIMTPRIDFDPGLLT